MMTESIIAAVEDMFFAAKIRATAEHLKLSVRFSRSAESVLQMSLETKPRLIIVDLHTQQYDPFALACILKSRDDLRSVPLFCFYSHVQTELRRRAEEAGFDRVLPRSAFTKRLPEILAGEYR
jgi:PleD family two-component response regulator